MNTKNLPIIIGIAMPVVFIILMSLIVYLPSLSIKPQYNFIYSNENGTSYSYSRDYANTYVVEDNRLVFKEVATSSDPNSTFRGITPTLYLYNVKDNTSRQITYDAAKGYTLDPGPASVDGYVVKHEYSHDGIFELFGSRGSNRGYFIEKDNGRKKLTGLTGDDTYYSYNFRFLGWVK